MERRGRLAIGESVRIAGEIAGALQYAHGRGVIHRDIKPGNILLIEGHVLVADFGIARAFSLADKGSLTQEGHSIGTPDYMSPEQAAAQEDLDGRTDMYSLACLLFEMLGGEPPFPSASSQATLARHLTEAPPSIRAVRKAVDPEIDGVIRRTMQKSPDERFGSVEEFGLALADAGSMAALNESAGRSRTTGRMPFPNQATPRWAQHAIGAMLVVAAVGVAWRAWGGQGTPPLLGEGVHVDSVAVMPFTNLTGDPGNDRLGVGLAAEITDMLAQVPEVKVISRHSVEGLETGVASVPQQLVELGVRHLIRGSIEQTGTRIVISVWHGEEDDGDAKPVLYEDDAVDWFASEARLALSITRDLLEDMGVSAATITASEGGAGREATLIGTHWLNRRTADGVRLAMTSFEEATVLDATYAPAYAGLSRAYALALTYRYNVGVDDYEAAGLSWSYADRAIELDPMFAGGYLARGILLLLSLAPLSDAEADFDRARELQPNNPSIPSWSARVLARTGDLEGALRAARRAVRLDPAQPGRHIAVAAHAMRAELYDLALEEARIALVLEADLMRPRAIEGRSLLLAGRSRECLDLPLGPHAVIRAMCLYDQGQMGAASAIVDSVATVTRAGGGSDPQFTDVIRTEDLASYYAWIGDVDQALTWLTRAYSLSPTGIEVHVLESEIFASVRNDAAFDLAVEGTRSQIWNRVRAASGRTAQP